MRLTVSDHAYRSIVWPKLAPILAAYPDIRLEVSIDNGLRDIVEERFDAGVRLGESVDKDMIAVRVGSDWRLVVVAAPGYLATRPAPRAPQDLVRHDCINHRQGRSGGRYAWEFEKDGREVRVRVEGSSPSTPPSPCSTRRSLAGALPLSPRIWSRKPSPLASSSRCSTT